MINPLRRIAVHCRYENITRDNFIFSSTDVLNGQNSLEPWHFLKNYYERQGITVSTLDVVPAGEQVDVLILIDRPKIPVKALDDVMADPQTLKILILLESPPVAPENWDLDYHKKFDYVFTWADDLVDGRFYIKSNFCGLSETRNHFPELLQKHDQRKLICMINSLVIPNEHYPKNELYSARLAFINYMQSTHPEEFDLYGNNWPVEHFKSFKGRSENKFKTFSNYKFSLCFENFYGYRGYISEKILDSLASGTVPVYLGAPNIADWIPKSCYVDFRDFNSFETLIAHLKAMSKDEYKVYIDSIHNFWTDIYKNNFSTANFLQNLQDYINWNFTSRCRLDSSIGQYGDAFRSTRYLYQHRTAPHYKVPLPKEEQATQKFQFLSASDVPERVSPSVMLFIGWDINYQLYRDCKRAWDLLLEHNKWLDHLFVDWNNHLERGQYVLDGKRLTIGCKSALVTSDSGGYYQSGVWSTEENDMSVFRLQKSCEIVLKRFPHIEQIWNSTITSIINPSAIKKISSLMPRTGVYAGFPGTLREGLYAGVQIIHGATPILSADVALKIVERFADRSPDTLIPNDHWLGIVLQDVARTPLPLFCFENPRTSPSEMEEVYSITSARLKEGFHHFRVKTKGVDLAEHDRLKVDPRILMRVAEAMLDCGEVDSQAIVNLQSNMIKSMLNQEPRRFPFDDSETSLIGCF